MAEKEEKEGEATEKKEGDESAEGEGEGGEAGGNKKKKIIIIAAALVLVLIITAIAVVFITGKSHPKPAAEGAPVVGEDGKAAPQAVFYDMEEFVVNLNVGSKRPSFLKMTVSLEVAGELQIPIVERNMPRVRDSFQIYLRELRQEDLQGSAGLYRLREELLLRVNKVIYPAKVNDILFKEVLVQ